MVNKVMTKTSEMIQVFWDVTPCRHVNTYWPSGGTWCFHLHWSWRRRHYTCSKVSNSNIV